MGILAKLMPLERVIAIASRLGFLAKPLQVLAQGWIKAQGFRTQLLILAAGAVAAAASLGFIDWEPAQSIIVTILTVAGPTFLEKWNRVAGPLEQVAAKVRDEANKQP